MKTVFALCLLYFAVGGQCSRFLSEDAVAGTVKTDTDVKIDGGGSAAIGSTGTIEPGKQQSTSSGDIAAGQGGNVKASTGSVTTTDLAKTETELIMRAKKGGSATGYAHATFDDGGASTSSSTATYGIAWAVAKSTVKPNVGGIIKSERPHP